MRRHLLTIGLILIGAPGCDNVAWGGTDLTVLPPPTLERVPDEVDEPDPESDEPVNEELPILLAGTRDGMSATLTVVGEVDGDGLRPFPDPAFPSDVDRLAELTRPGSEWILFSEGARIGRLFVESTAEAGRYCGARTTVSGITELVPTAAQATRLLALPAADVMDRGYGEYGELQHVYDQRVATLEIVQAAIPEYGAVWPRLGVLDARKHIQAFDLAGPRGPFVAATFVYQDTLGVAPPGAGAYAFFVLGEEVGGEQQGVYTWYREAETEGKGVPRYFDHLDWNGDGTEEILLDVFGASRRWFAGLARRDGAWVRTFEDDCGSGATTAG